MSVAVSINSVDTTNNQLIVSGVLTLTGNYGGGATHGDTLNFQGDTVKSSSLPTAVVFTELAPAGAAGSGNFYYYMQGTTQANGALQVWTAAGAEYAQGTAYGTPPFGIAGFKLAFQAYFPSL